MRAYFIPLAAGALLAVSAFLPWVVIGEDGFGGMPDMAGLWILGLGLSAVLLAALSIVTRKNSRHPLLIVGLAALGIMILAIRVLSRAATERAWALSQARAIVEGSAAQRPPPAIIGTGIYLGLAASLAIVLFGLTIVVRRVSRPYAVPEDDDV
jgi:hypothetical protein